MVNPKVASRISQKSIGQDKAFADRVQFKGEPFTPGAGILTQTIRIEVTTAQGVLVKDSGVAQIKVDILSGTATNKKLKSLDNTVIGTVDNPITVQVVDGFVDIVIEATVDGDWVLGLDGSVDAVAATLVTSDEADGLFIP